MNLAAEESSLEPIVSASTIDVVVRCEVGRVVLSIKDLLELRVGKTLTISNWPQTVKLSANGVYIAEGFLVEVNEMLAVKITKKLAYSGK